MRMDKNGAEPPRGREITSIVVELSAALPVSSSRYRAAGNDTGPKPGCDIFPRKIDKARQIADSASDGCLVELSGKNLVSVFLPWLMILAAPA